MFIAFDFLEVIVDPRCHMRLRHSLRVFQQLGANLPTSTQLFVHLSNSFVNPVEREHHHLDHCAMPRHINLYAMYPFD